MERLGYDRYVAQGGDWGAVSPSRWAPGTAGLAGSRQHSGSRTAGRRGGARRHRSSGDDRRGAHGVRGARRVPHERLLGYFVALTTGRRRSATASPTRPPVSRRSSSGTQGSPMFGDNASGRATCSTTCRLLAHEHRCLIGAPVLGEPRASPTSAAAGTQTRSVPPGHVFPDDVYRPPESWGGAPIRPRLLQRRRQGRALRRLGATGALQRGDAGGVPAASRVGDRSGR